MADARRSDHSAPINELPDEIYIGFVDGLLTDILPVVLLSAIAVTCGEIAAAIAANSLILGVAAPAQLLIAAVRLQLAKRHARNIPEPHGRRSPACGSEFSRPAPRQPDRAVVVDPARVLRDRQQFCPFHRRVDDDRLRVQPDVAQLRDLPRGQCAAVGRFRSAFAGDDRGRRLVSGGDRGRDRPARPLHEGLRQAAERQLHGGGGGAASRPRCWRLASTWRSTTCRMAFAC